MVIRVPDYYAQFQCLAGDCPHSCCEKWEVVLDEAHVRAYQGAAGALGERLRNAMQEDADGDVCFALNGGRCPFLDGENLCEIHRQLGAEATSVTCQEHPRFTEDYGAFREITLSASCPAANALLLGSEVPLRFVELETDETAEDGDSWLPYLLPLRARMLAMLAERGQPLKARLRSFLLLAAAAQEQLDAGTEACLPELAMGWRRAETKDTADKAGTGDAEVRDFGDSGAVAAALARMAELEILDADWPTLLAQAKAAAPRRISEPLLERICTYFAFRYLLKCVNDGDLLSRAQLCVLATLVIGRLAAACGLSEALRRFSCEIEHNEDNLEALLEALWQEEALSLPQLMAALEDEGSLCALC